MKLKYTDNQRTTFSYVRTELGKTLINLTVDSNDIVEVEDILAKGLLGTGKFIEIKDFKATKKAKVVSDEITLDESPKINKEGE